MSDDIFYLVSISINEDSRFGLWLERDEGDIFLSDDITHDIISKKSINEIIEFSKNKNLKIKIDDYLKVDLDHIYSLIESLKNEKTNHLNADYCSNILDFFNVSQDLLRSMNISTNTDVKLNNILVRIFDGIDIFTIQKERKGIFLSCDDVVLLESYFSKYKPYYIFAFYR